MADKLKIAAEICGYLVAIGAVGAGAWKYIFNPLILVPIKQLRLVYENVSHIPEIRKELLHNGGGSLKDIVLRSDKTIVRLDDKISRVEERQRVMLLDVAQGHFETDENGSWVKVNNTLCKLLGKTQAELLSFGWVSLIAGDERESIFIEYQQAIKHKRQFEAVVRMSKDQPFWVVAKPMFCADRNFCGFFAEVTRSIPPEEIERRLKRDTKTLNALKSSAIEKEIKKGKL